MNEIEILNYAQMNFIQNGLYMVAFTAFVFITFRLIRFQREQNANIFGKVLVTNLGYVQYFLVIMYFLFYIQINYHSHLDYLSFNPQELRYQAFRNSGLTLWVTLLLMVLQFLLVLSLPLIYF